MLVCGSVVLRAWPPDQQLQPGSPDPSPDPLSQKLGHGASNLCGNNPLPRGFWARSFVSQRIHTPLALRPQNAAWHHFAGGCRDFCPQAFCKGIRQKLPPMAISQVCPRALLLCGKSRHPVHMQRFMEEVKKRAICGSHFSKS